MNDLNNSTALNDLIETVGSDVCASILEEFWECWITSDTIDRTDSLYRSQRLAVYKCLRKFLQDIKKENCN